MKKLTSFICALASLLVFMSPVTAAFNDMVNQSHWGYDALSYAIDNSVIQGFEDNTVRPNENLTRAQMAAIVVRLVKTSTIADMSQFIDVDKDAWYYSTLETAVGLGLFVGNGDGHLYPNNPITRQETFVVISRMLNLRGVSGDTEFTDNDKIADWARGYIKALYNEKYISGDNLKNINPASNITRIEFAQLVYNIYKTNEAENPEGTEDDNSSATVFSRVRKRNTTKNNEEDAEVSGNIPHQSNVEVFVDEDDPFADTYVDISDLFGDEE